MRDHLASVIAIATTIMCSTLSAQSQVIPTLDVRPVCRGIANQSADPGVGQGSQDETYRQCIETEQATREQIEKEWTTFSAADKRHCVVLATTGGESSNTELLTCLEMARDVRVLRSAAAASSSSADTLKPTPSPPKPAPSPPTTTVQPPPAATTARPTPLKESPKTEGRLAITEVERAKAETEAAKASEAMAQCKLADAEAALQRAKEEAGRAIAEAERARAAAQLAKESEAAATRKLADAEAARAAAEKACTAAARPGLVGRLRGWLKHPASKSP
jgi:colicin import membrane protein